MIKPDRGRASGTALRGATASALARGAGPAGRRESGCLRVGAAAIGGLPKPVAPVDGVRRLCLAGRSRSWSGSGSRSGSKSHRSRRAGAMIGLTPRPFECLLRRRAGGQQQAALSRGRLAAQHRREHLAGPPRARQRPRRRPPAPRSTGIRGLDRGEVARKLARGRLLALPAGGRCVGDGGHRPRPPPARPREAPPPGRPMGRPPHADPPPPTGATLCAPAQEKPGLSYPHPGGPPRRPAVSL